jgi:NAD(P) transhydrogenase subunit alpha
MIAIGVPAEAADEPRIGLTPETVKKLVKAGAEITIRSGAGERSHFSDQDYAAAGAKIAKSDAEAVGNADIVLTVRRPDLAIAKAMKKGAALIGMLDPFSDAGGLDALANSGVLLFSMELMPRITRAQSMDVLSSQSNLAGYKAVVDAAAAFERALPMMMTAAGTVPAARVFIMGVGVAGLQAIATARRLGAIVSATDVRPAVKEQVASLGAKFIAVEDEEFKQAETAGGYAKEMSDAYKKKQAELIAEHIKGQDIIITTALIPGRPAPKLISKAMIESMKPGSIIVDLAAERGGNTEVTQPDEIAEHNGVRIFGKLNLPGTVPVNASSLYARNLQAFIEPLIDKQTNKEPRHQLGRRTRQGHADRARRRHRECDDRRDASRTHKAAMAADGLSAARTSAMRTFPNT